MNQIYTYATIEPGGSETRETPLKKTWLVEATPEKLNTTNGFLVITLREEDIRVEFATAEDSIVEGTIRHDKLYTTHPRTRR